MESLRFTTEDGVSLEGDLRLPDGDVRGSAVICHPHPRHGGSKDHPLLWASRSELALYGLAVLAFNFRGVMRSAGSYGAGRAEVRDADAAVGRIREEVEGPTLVCGWSFGANVALREAVADDRVAACALIGIPLAEAADELPPLPGASELRAFDRPVLFLSGEGDTFSPHPELELLARSLPRVEVAIVPGTDHFFWRREREVAALIGGFAHRALLR